MIISIFILLYFFSPFFVVYAHIHLFFFYLLISLFTFSFLFIYLFIYLSIFIYIYSFSLFAHSFTYVNFLPSFIILLLTLNCFHVPTPSLCLPHFCSWRTVLHPRDPSVIIPFYWYCISLRTVLHPRDPSVIIPFYCTVFHYALFYTLGTLLSSYPFIVLYFITHCFTP